MKNKQRNFRLNPQYVYLLSLFIFGIVLGISFLSLPDTFTVRFFSSDSLYLPAIYHDVFIKGIGIEGWRLNEAPNYFPDMLLFFLCNTITKSLVSASFLYGFLYVLFIVLAIHLISRELYKNNHHYYVTLSLSLVLLPFFALLISGNYRFAYYLTINAYHTSAFLMSLYSLYIVLLIPKYNKPLFLYVLLGLMVVLAMISDKLYLVTFVTPLLLSYISEIRWGFKKHYLKIMLVTVSAVLLSIQTTGVIQRTLRVEYMESETIIDFSKISDSLQSFFYFNLELIKEYDLISLLIILSYITFIYLIIDCIKNYNKFQFFEKFYVFFFLCTALTPIILNLFHSISQFRYNVFIFYITFLTFPYLLNKIGITVKFIKWVSLLAMASMLIILFSNIKELSFSNIRQKETQTNIDKQLIQQLNELKEPYQLKGGVSSYWRSKPVSLFSNDIPLRAVYSTLNPNYSNTGNKFWYLTKPNSDTNIFNFIVVDDRINEEVARSFFDEKCYLEIYSCEDFKIVKVPDFIYKERNFQPVVIDIKTKY